MKPRRSEGRGGPPARATQFVGQPRWFYQTPGPSRRRQLIFRIPHTRGVIYRLPCALPWPSPNFHRGRPPGTDGWPPQRDPKLVSPQVREPREHDMLGCAAGRHLLEASRCTPNPETGFTDCEPRPVSNSPPPSNGKGPPSPPPFNLIRRLSSRCPFSRARIRGCMHYSPADGTPFWVLRIF